MKLTKIFTVTLALTIIFAGVHVAEAMNGGHRGGGLFALKTLLELDLSDSQKSQILGIYAKYDLKTAWSNIKKNFFIPILLSPHSNQCQGVRMSMM
jgi:hypothetical protein